MGRNRQNQLKAICIIIMIISACYIAVTISEKTKTEIYDETAYCLSGDEKSGSSGLSELQSIEPYLSSLSSLSVNDTFYYNNLSDEEKGVYNQIYNIFINRLDYTEVNSSDYDEVSNITHKVMFDHPELFYISKNLYRIPENGNIQVTGKIELTEDEIEDYIEKLKEYTSEAMNGLDSISMENQYETALHFYDYIIENAEYSKESIYNQSIASVLDGKTVCLGYSKMYKYLCDRVGIKNIIVVGYAEGESHAWNLVELDGSWCYIDLTYGYSHRYNLEDMHSSFGMTKQQLDRIYIIDDKEINISSLPVADSLENNYMNKNGLYFEEYDEDRLKEILREAIETEEEVTLNRNESKQKVIQVSTEGVMNEIYKKLTDSNNFDNLYPGDVDGVVVDKIDSKLLLYITLKIKPDA